MSTHYGTDNLADAWPLVDEMRDDGWFFRIDCNLQSLWRVMFTDDRTGREIIRFDFDLPHAIREAAVEARTVTQARSA